MPEHLQGVRHLSQLRVVDASPDAPGLDVYQGSSALAYNLGLGTITSYVPIGAGQGITIQRGHGRFAATKTAACLLYAGRFLPRCSNTRCWWATTRPALQELILKDQSISVRRSGSSRDSHRGPVGEGGRGGHLSDSGGFYDCRFDGAADHERDLQYQTTGYMDIPAGTYSLVALPTGTTAFGDLCATLYSGAAVNYPGAGRRGRWC